MIYRLAFFILLATPSLYAQVAMPPERKAVDDKCQALVKSYKAACKSAEVKNPPNGGLFHDCDAAKLKALGVEVPVTDNFEVKVWMLNEEAKDAIRPHLACKEQQKSSGLNGFDFQQFDRSISSLGSTLTFKRLRPDPGGKMTMHVSVSVNGGSGVQFDQPDPGQKPVFTALDGRAVCTSGNPVSALIDGQKLNLNCPQTATLEAQPAAAK